MNASRSRLTRDYTLGGGVGVWSDLETLRSSTLLSTCAALGAGKSDATRPAVGESGTATKRTDASPLHESAEIDGHGQVDREDLLAHADAHPRSEQAASAVRRHEPSHPFSARSSLRAACAIPLLRSFLISITHPMQWPSSPSTIPAAAIHCSSVNSTPRGGRTPFRIAQANRSSGVWQQQFDQHSCAEAHPHPHASHGYRSDDASGQTRPSQPVIAAGDGSIPIVAPR